MIRLDPDLCLQVAVPSDAHTLAGFRAWVYSDEFPERARISLIQGEVIVDMSPERVQTHGKAKIEIMRVLGNLVHEADSGELYPDGVWFTNDEAALSTEPDCGFASWETLSSGRLQVLSLGSHPRDGIERDGIEMRGSPDWMLEIISPTSFRKDTKLLPAAYFAAGVYEFWLVDARGDELQFTVFERAEKEFVAVAPHDCWHPSRVFGHEFRLERELDRLGGWRYTLHVR